MTVVIEDYSDSHTTEPMYISECLRRVGVDSRLCPHIDSLPIVLEEKKPEVTILSLANSTDASIKACKDHMVDVALNCNGLSRENIKVALGRYIENNVKVFCLFGETLPLVTIKGIKLVNIKAGADIFSSLLYEGKDFSFPDCVMINHSMSIPNLTGLKSYHTVSLFGHSDISTKVVHIPRIINCYENVTIVNGDQGDSQFLYDSLYYANNPKVIDLSGNQLSKSLSRNLCTDRVSRLLSKIGFSSVAEVISKIEV